MSSSVCRVCLASNLSMTSITNNLLIDVYEKLSSNKFFSDDARPRALCFACYRKLLRCYSFSEMVNRSEKLFNQVFGIEASHEYIPEHQGMKPFLSVAPMKIMEINASTNEDESMLVKEEVTTEDNQWIEVKTELDKNIDVEEFSPNMNVQQNKLDDSIMTFSSRSKPNEKYSCDVCDRQFHRIKKLNKHKLKHAKKLFICNECNKEFNRKRNIVIHMSIHSGQKPFACLKCNRQFNMKGNLNQHMKTHTGTKPYACRECDKAFARRSTLVRHKITHTEEKPFACNVCDRQYKQKNNLVTHMRNHNV